MGMIMKLIVVDTETSGLLPEQGATILELAWMTMQAPTWVTDSAYETYIQYSGPIDPRAQASHHIRADCLTVERGAITREQAVATLLNEIESDTYLVAHNADFDSKFLAEIATPWICTYRIAKHLWPDAPGHGNQVLRYWLGVKPDLSRAPSVKQRAPHQALYDVATTTGILQKMLENYTPDELYQITKGPNLLKKIGFGKHKGAEFVNVPRDYMAWLRGQPDLEPDLKYTLDHYLHG
jgi:exodeoxyribonuclease X